MDDDSYLPVNGPAIGNLLSLFTFGDRRDGDDRDDRGDDRH
jgi:hypothetical protein